MSPYPYIKYYPPIKLATQQEIINCLLTLQRYREVEDEPQS